MYMKRVATLLLPLALVACAGTSPVASDRSGVFAGAIGEELAYPEIMERINLENYVWNAHAGHDVRQMLETWGKFIGFSVDWQSRSDPQVVGDRVFVGNYFDAARDLIGGGVEGVEIEDGKVCIDKTDGRVMFESEALRFKLDIDSKVLIVSDRK